MAGHVPHLYLPGPWVGPELPLGEDHVHHLHKVLRRRQGDPVTYTDGEGLSGQGVFSGPTVLRGPESLEAPHHKVRLAVSPPDDKNRQRFLVEKLGELGVDRLTWIKSKWGEGKAPAAGKARKWAIGALEQSRSSRLITVDEGMEPLSNLGGRLWVCEQTGSSMPRPQGDEVLVIGPEAGLDSDEPPAGSTIVSLGSQTLRVETAAVVATALYLDRLQV